MKRTLASHRCPSLLATIVNDFTGPTTSPEVLDASGHLVTTNSFYPEKLLGRCVPEEFQFLQSDRVAHRDEVPD